MITCGKSKKKEVFLENLLNGILSPKIKAII
jgi:hypothetical protein